VPDINYFSEDFLLYSRKCLTCLTYCVNTAWPLWSLTLMANNSPLGGGVHAGSPHLGAGTHSTLRHGGPIAGRPMSAAASAAQVGVFIDGPQTLYKLFFYHFCLTWSRYGDGFRRRVVPRCCGQLPRFFVHLRLASLFLDLVARLHHTSPLDLVKFFMRFLGVQARFRPSSRLFFSSSL
jgi:hypothetical protein